MQDKRGMVNTAHSQNTHLLRPQQELYSFANPASFSNDARQTRNTTGDQNTPANSSDQFVGNYRLLRSLGYGSFGSVYLAEHRYLKRLAAIKILRATLNDRDREKFLAEARLLGSLSHPNIVRVLEFAVTQRGGGGQEDNQLSAYIPYLVMDFAPGDSLRVFCRPGTCLFPTTAINYVKQIAAALQHAHDKGIIHRDVKPENCLLNERQEAMLSDFGLALFAPTPDLLSTQHLEGTLPYTAPEQLRGKPTFASDQYSLAIIAYEWLCGQRPFVGEDLTIIMQHIYSPPPSLRDKNHAISPAIEAVIMKALSKDPQQRYPTIATFAHELEQASLGHIPELSSIKTFSPLQSPPHVFTLPFFPDTEHLGTIKQESSYTHVQSIDTDPIDGEKIAVELQKKQPQSPHFPQKRGTRLSLLIVCLIAVMLIVVNGPSIAPTSLSLTQSSTAHSWHLNWSDEFNGDAGTGVNQNNWFYDTGTTTPNGSPNWGTGEVETMSKSTANVFQDGTGDLAIKPIRKNGQWTSGRIETQRADFMAPPGGKLAVEASIRLPDVTGAASLGYWSSLSLLGTPYRGNYTNWPSVGEINMLQNINGFNNTVGTLHCGPYPGGPCNEPNGLSGQSTCHVTTCQASFHTYRVEYDRSTSPEQIRWYLDGVQFWQVSSNQPGVDATTWANALHHGFFLILEVAMGGSFPASAGGGPTPATASGASLLINYIRVYTTNG